MTSHDKIFKFFYNNLTFITGLNKKLAMRLSFIGRDYARIKFNKILHKKIENQSYPPILTFLRQKMYFAGEQQNFTKLTSMFKNRPTYNKNIKKVLLAYVDNYVFF
jgi:hypothetical protein